MRRETSVMKQCKYKMITKGLDYDKTFHKAKLILKIYRDVVWSLSEEVDEMQHYAYELGEQNIETGICYLENFAPDIDVDEFTNRVCRTVQSKMLVDIINKTLVKLKNYPTHGDIYFEILTKQFIYRFKYTEKEMLDILRLERSTFYERKKEAINLFAVCLFGFTLPELREIPTKQRSIPDTFPT